MHKSRSGFTILREAVNSGQTDAFDAVFDAVEKHLYPEEVYVESSVLIVPLCDALIISATVCTYSLFVN